jgi:hypothetical protein
MDFVFRQDTGSTMSGFEEQRLCSQLYVISAIRLTYSQRQDIGALVPQMSHGIDPATPEVIAGEISILHLMYNYAPRLSEILPQMGVYLEVQAASTGCCCRVEDADWYALSSRLCWSQIHLSQDGSYLR